MGTSGNRTYASALAFRTALDERARRRQRDTGESVQLVRRCYAFEAFLRRIPRSGQPLVLKGGYLMQLRYAVGTRLTKDLDAALRDEALSTQPSEVIAQRLQAALVAVAKVPDVDFFTFDVSAPRQDLGADREFVGCRFSVVARVNNRVKDLFDVVVLLDRGVAPEDVAVVIEEVFRHAGHTPLVRLAQEVPEGWRSAYDGFVRDHQLNVSFDRACELHRALCSHLLQHSS
jgi:hypothetical protein